MPPFSTAIIQGHLTAGDNARTRAAKGKALEDLACYLFGMIPGLSITERNAMNPFDTEEIDVACWNEQDAAGLKSFNVLILVECKNWSQAVSSQEVNWFLTKIENRGRDFGILLAMNGVTGNPDDGRAAHHLISVALIKKIRLIVITRAEIEKLTHTDDLVTLIRRKVCQLVVSGTVWP